ncbi:MAG: malate dehydrogenase [Nitrospirota bacterium]|jgi:malate dehydrogenase
MKKKVSVIGAGNVGATIAQLLAQAGLSDVVLFDIVEGLAAGKALDILEACPLWGSASRVEGTTDYAATSGSDIAVITAGLPRKPGMSRDDLLQANADIVREAAEAVSKASPGAMLIVVTNPMDVMTQLAWRASGLEHQRVMGMGGVLDSARFRTFVAQEAGVSPADVEALVLGGHGDQMVPLPRFTTVKGVPVTEMFPEEKVRALIDRTRNGGAEIVGYLKTGSAYYAPAASVFEMAKSILLDEKRVLPTAAYLAGEYGVEGLYAGVPAVLGSSGVEKVVELRLSGAEKDAFERSVSAVRGLTQKLGIT